MSEMPQQLELLFGLMVVGLLIEAASLNWFGVPIYMLVIFGILKGSEIIRSFMIWGGFRYYIIFSLMLLPFVIVRAESAQLPLALVEAALWIYPVWCLRHPDVQSWMLTRSLKLDDLEQAV